MSKDHNGGRYVPNNTELDILITAIHEYFDKPERSTERNSIIDCTLPKLSSYPHWTKSRIRIWFTNNQKKYINTTTGHFNPPLPPPPLPLPPPHPAPAIPEKMSLKFTEDFLSVTSQSRNDPNRVFDISRPNSRSWLRSQSPANLSVDDRPLDPPDDFFDSPALQDPFTNCLLFQNH
jgi:hypothetical protein